ncbi:cytochrome b/b6 domain-containing protein [Octadecabacter sp. 1_MG-2023]|uniref:cytochrome b n=1 Tax=unclassified Octadecabacter TaxID=196158 RepID=UPI001C091CCB|nr:MULTISPECIES: cytochrome b/b6 domain-containing protein [unclassified Octadecabacter]MBU2992422.1 cytochrome b/b6 domain-containing protein [Octadecabacter sp. B2R22]MDO6734821.1 cytochrome b/b6 domain-containing protein [Octadecabacter sp. 1_MG-2023]
MTRYHPALVVLHWLLALMIIAGLIMGSQVLSETANDDPFKLTALRMHMTMGLVILGLMVIRLVIRLRSAKPPHADIGNGLLNKGAQAAHWVFYLLVFALCASGIAMAKMAGLPDIVFGGSGAPLPESFFEFGPRKAHGTIALVLGLLIAAHVIAGLYHQYGRKDRLFSRMWFGNRTGGE